MTRCVTRMLHRGRAASVRVALGQIAGLETHGEVGGPVGLHAQKVDPPGGTTGRVGFGTEVDEAPVPDAKSTTEAFSSEVVFRFA